MWFQIGGLQIHDRIQLTLCLSQSLDRGGSEQAHQSWFLCMQRRLCWHRAGSRGFEF